MYFSKSLFYYKLAIFIKNEECGDYEIVKKILLYGKDQ